MLDEKEDAAMILDAYKLLYKYYGPQGWWPLIDFQGTNPTKTGSVNGYHPGDYSLPKTRNQVYEICIGSLLTQYMSFYYDSKVLNI